MKKTFNKIRLMLALLILASGASAYLLLYTPLYNAFRKLTLDNYMLAAGTLTDSALEYIARCKEGAAGLSSRTMIRKAILSYREGKIDFEQLRNTTAEPYQDGVKILDHLIGVARVVDGRILVRSGNVFPIEPGTTFSVQKIQLRFLFPETQNGLERATELEVVSPIFEGSQILGYDVALFELQCLAVQHTENNGINLSIISGAAAAQLREGTAEPYRSRAEELVHWDEKIGFLQKVDDSGSCALADTSCDALFSDGESFAIVNLFRFLTILLILLGGSNLFIMVTLRRVLKRVELSRDAYLEYATHDPLTGLLTRRFLELWSESELPSLSEGYCIVMIDLDRFKEINDTLGHEAGDEALKHLAAHLLGAIRTQDLAIRQGGDEFLLWLRGVGEDQARAVMERFEERLAQAPFRGNSLSVSWGLYEVSATETRSISTFARAVRLADEFMYENKKIKK